MENIVDQFKDWIVINKLNFSPSSEELIFTLNDKKYLIIEPKSLECLTPENNTELRDFLFDEDFYLILSEKELSLLRENNPDYYVFQFGNYFYYHSVNSDHSIKDFKMLKYVGTAVQDIDIEYCNLGIHGGYELMSGMHEYESWISKALFLGHKYIGICEKNTLAGTLPLQIACKGKDITPIIGETIVVRQKDSSLYELKLYCQSEVGWKNLLWINKLINVDHVSERFITEEELFDKQITKDLILVIPKDFKLTTPKINTFIQYFKEIYFQFDLNQYFSQSRDTEVLSRLKFYMDSFFNKTPIKPLLLLDTYYLDQEHHHLRRYLNTIGVVQTFQSDEQYYKNLDDIIIDFEQVFPSNKLFQGIDFIDFFKLCAENTIELAQKCNFTIPIKTLKLPKYEFKHFGKTDEELLKHLISEGWDRHNLSSKENSIEYRERVDRELDVIKRGGFIDYFLILWDIIDWCKRNDILTGIGRGSAAGSLIAYLLGITKIDPIEYDLLFERFLNESRIKEGLPDIDTDTPTSKRDEVKRYIEQRFGVDNVCSVGTYTTYGIKSYLKDFGKFKGLDVSQSNYINSLIPSDISYYDLFKLAQDNPTVKTFINTPKWFDLINDMQWLLNQPKASSVHAAALIITPNKDEHGDPTTIYNWMPIKSIDGVLVSEWEGSYLEKAGFLKEDLLGIKQLDKFKDTVDLIKKTTGVDVDIYNIPLNDNTTFSLFKEGYNEDVFHFGAPGLRNYCKDVQPENIEELIAMNALYRPGPIQLNFHNYFTLIKHNKKTPEYMWGTHDILKSTYGLMVYQEQILQMVQKLADFSLVEADNIRRAIGKKDAVLMASYQDKFLERIQEKGCPEDEANRIWRNIYEFAGYSFNRSHAACYSITGYVCQWLKANYPLQFYSVSLDYSKEDELTGRTIEIDKVGEGINLLPPDINYSLKSFNLDYDKQSIYWGLESVVSEAVVDYLIQERDTNGLFYSFEEFIGRVEKRKCNKRAIINLILSGSFDEILSITDVRDRYILLEKYFNKYLKKTDKIEDEIDVSKIRKEYYWIGLQKGVCGYGNFNFEKIRKESKVFKETKLRYVDSLFLQKDNIEREKVLVGGVISRITIRKTKNGPMGVVWLLNEGDYIIATMWNDSWEKYKHEIVGNENNLMFISGVVKFDTYKKCNVVYSNDETKVEIL